MKQFFKKLWKKNTWNTRFLVDETFVPVTKQLQHIIWKIVGCYNLYLSYICIGLTLKVHVWFVTENQTIWIDTDKNAVDFCLFLWLFKLLQDVLPNLLLLFFSYPLKSGIFIGLFNGCGQKKQVAYLLLRNYLTTFFGWLPCFSSLTYRISLCWLPELNTWVI